jgi:hypothetical protein
MYYKTKTFSSQFVVEKDSANQSWNLINKTDDIDSQINNWVDATESMIITSSAPSMHAEWLDSDHAKKIIILSVIIIYLPKGADNDGTYPEFREPAGSDK